MKYVTYRGVPNKIVAFGAGLRGLGDTGIGPGGEFGSAQMSAKLAEAMGLLGQLQTALQQAQAASNSYLPQIQSTGVTAAVQQANAEVGAIPAAQQVFQSMTSTLNGISVPAATMANFNATNSGYLEIQNQYEPQIQAATQSISNLGPQLQAILVSAQQAQANAQAAQATVAVQNAQAQAQAAQQAADAQAQIAAGPNASPAQQAAAAQAQAAATQAANAANQLQAQDAASIANGSEDSISSQFYSAPQSPAQIQAAQAATAAAAAAAQPSLASTLLGYAPYAVLAGIAYEVWQKFKNAKPKSVSS